VCVCDRVRECVKHERLGAACQVPMRLYGSYSWGMGHLYGSCSRRGAAQTRHAMAEHGTGKPDTMFARLPVLLPGGVRRQLGLKE